MSPAVGDPFGHSNALQRACEHAACPPNWEKLEDYALASEGGTVGALPQSPFRPKTQGYMRGAVSTARRFILMLFAEHPFSNPKERQQDSQGPRKEMSTKRPLFELAQRRKDRGLYAGWSDWARTEAFLLSLKGFDWFTPNSQAHPVVLSACLLFALCIVTAFMAGAYPAYQEAEVAGHSNRTSANISDTWSPSQLLTWLSLVNGSWESMDPAYVAEWGGFSVQDIRAGHQSSWLSSLLLHDTLVTLLADCALLLPTAFLLEHKFGLLRVLFIASIAALGSFFVRALAGVACTDAVGPLGVIFGLIGLQATDAVATWRSAKARVGLTSFLVGALVFTRLAIAFMQGAIPYALALGGFVSVFPATLLVLPRLWSELAEAAILPMCLVQILVLGLGLPLGFFLWRLPMMQCPK